MSKKNKINIKNFLISLLIFLVFFSVAGFAKIKLVGAANSPLFSKGWLWGGSDDASTAGKPSVAWLSINSDDVGAGGSFSYGVNIPISDGPVTGYAWSSNLQSYIDFQPSVSCSNGSYAGACDGMYPAGPAGGDVARAGNKLVGWARIVSIAAANAVGNSGGDDGWISLDPGGDGYGVTIDDSPVSNNVSGYGWAGGSLGAMSFSGVTVPVKPKITIDPVQNRFFLTAGQTTANANFKTDVRWTVTSQGTPSCSSSCSSGICSPWSNPSWDGLVSGLNSGTVGSVAVAPSDSIMRFSMNCTDTVNGLTASTESGPIQVGCVIKTCGGSNNEKCVYDPNAEGAFILTTNFDATPDCKSGCKSDDDCKLRQGKNWREVAP